MAAERRRKVSQGGERIFALVCFVLFSLSPQMLRLEREADSQ